MESALAHLPDPYKQLRLIYLHAGQEHDAISVSTSIWSREQSPTYRAISYTWGEPTSIASIVIDGQVREVRENCAYALWQARLRYPDSYVWIDSICIDQNNHFEKGAQVSIMYEIYAQATWVLACVGKPDASSDFLFSVLPHIDARTAVSQGFADDSNADHELPLALVSTNSPLKQLLDSFDMFSERSYFHRVWVVQELHAGRHRTTTHCGSKILKWHSIIQLYDRLAPLVRTYRPKWLFYHPPPSQTIIAIDRIADGRDELLWGFYHILRDGPSQCVDPRDRIYGVLKLINWELIGVERPVPNYDIPVWQLALQVLNLNSTPDHYTVARALRLGDDLEATVLGLLGLPERPHVASAQITRKFIVSSACEIRVDEQQRLCADLIRQESPVSTGRPLEIHVAQPGRESPSLLPFNGQDPLPVFTTSRVSAFVCPQTLPGDLLIEAKPFGFLVLRSYDKWNMSTAVSRMSSKYNMFTVVGKASIAPDHAMKGGDSRAWYCKCQRASERTSRPKYVSIELTLSDREMLCLYAADTCETDHGQSLQSALPIPKPGTVVRGPGNRCGMNCYQNGVLQEGLQWQTSVGKALQRLATKNMPELFRSSRRS